MLLYIALTLSERGKANRVFRSDGEGRISIEESKELGHFRSTLIIDIPGAALGIWNTPPADLQLRAAFRIVGKVQRRDGMPVAGASLTVVEFGAHTYVPMKAYGVAPPWKVVMTDEKGRFVLKGGVFNGFDFPPGIAVRAVKVIDGRKHSSVHRFAGKGDATFFKEPGAKEPKEPTVVLHPVGEVKGRVIHELTGEPVTGAKVHYYGGTGETTVNVLTGADGSFRLEGIPGHKSRRFKISGKGFAELSVSQVAKGPPAAADVDNLVLSLAPLVQVEGTVVDAHTKAVPQLRLELEARREQTLTPGWIGRMGASLNLGQAGAFNTDETITKLVINVLVQNVGGGGRVVRPWFDNQLASCAPLPSPYAGPPPKVLMSPL